MSDVVVKLMVEQRKRLVGSILGAAEQSQWWPKMTLVEQREFRAKILDSVGVFYDLVRDVIKVSHDDTLRNEHAIALLEQVHDSQRRVERATRTVA